MRSALLLVLALLALPLQALELQPFSASYTADWKQVPMSGTAVRNLTAEDDGRWKLEFEASMLVAGLNERSTFTVEGDTFLPERYRHERSGLGKGKRIDQRFDWAAKQVVGTYRGDPISLPLNRGLLDKSTYQVALQHDSPPARRA